MHDHIPLHPMQAFKLIFGLSILYFGGLILLVQLFRHL